MSRMLVTICTTAACFSAYAPLLAGEKPELKKHTNSLGMKFVLIPAGDFLMGSPPEEINALVKEYREAKFHDWYQTSPPSEGNQRKVTISRAFYLGIHEVTLKDFRAFVDATGYKTTAEKSGRGGSGQRAGKWIEAPEFNWRNMGYDSTDDEPVVNVSWRDAVAFCAWLSKLEKRRYRLPTEAEWEYACRAGTKTRSFWGDDAKVRREYAWTAENAEGRPHRVGTLKPNAWGLYDMLGNAYEYCADYYSAGPFRAEPVTDPAGPKRGEARVVRGVSWGTDARHARCAFRGDA